MMQIHPVTTMGTEGVPLWTIDAAHPAPDLLLDAASRASFAAASGDLYPGRRAPAPPEWAEWLQTALPHWPGLSGASLLRADFAIADRDPASLAPVQRIPHFDDSDGSIVALVHYLCDAPHGGTTFHRHRATGFERVTAERAPMWRQALASDAARHGMPGPRYHAGNTDAFVQIGGAALRFNRAIAYPANCLHCGDVAQGWASADRLTITALLRL